MGECRKKFSTESMDKVGIIVKQAKAVFYVIFTSFMLSQSSKDKKRTKRRSSLHLEEMKMM